MIIAMDEFVRQMETLQRLRTTGQFEKGLQLVQTILRQKRKFLHPQQAYFYKQQAILLHDLGEEVLAVDAFFESACNSAILQEQQEDYSNYLMLSHYLPHLEDAELAARHFGYNQLFATIHQQKHVQRKNRKKLRVGYISPDFRQHIVADFTRVFFSGCDRNRFEIIGYDITNQPDSTAGWFQNHADGWRILSGLEPKKAAEKIYNDEIDILVDLAGHSSGGHTLRIVGYKPAPLQISGIGYMSTTGMSAMDYFLTDVYCDPLAGGSAQFSEQLLRLPHSHFCYTAPERLQLMPVVHVQHRGIVFGSFNNFSKITDEMLQIWHYILEQVPGSKLLLKNSHGYRQKQENQLRCRAEVIGYQPDELEIRSASADYLEQYKEVDIALDTYPYPGGGTTCEALYMGVPVISLYGSRHGSRFGYSLLQNIGIGELAAATPEGYVERAVALASDPQLLRALQKQLRPMMQASCLMNQKVYMQSIERFYEEIWQSWCQK